LKIHFKEVGNGDSIIVEWQDNEDYKIGIIDSNVKKDNSNPTLNHVIASGYTSIHFILLSHPHFDHYSGLNQILQYCESHNILINFFLHTADKIPESLKASVNGHVAKSELEKVFETVERLYDNGLVQNAGCVSNLTQEFPVGGDWAMKFLAPTDKEFREFVSKKYRADLTQKINTSVANLLCTCIRISNGKFHILLTSDLV
jgi:competence protein ComEC